MSNDESRKVCHDIQVVQNLIEQCLLRYMTQKEVVNILSAQEKIEPSVTELVWQKLEQENQEFFNAYHLRLMLKEQIVEFNKLLGKQVEMMHHVDTTGVSYVPVNGSHTPPMHHNSSSYASENMRHTLKTENMRQPVNTNLPNEFANHGLSVPCMQTPLDMSAQLRKNEISSNMVLAPNSNVSMTPGPNGGMMKREAGYPGMSQYIYGADGNLMETCPLIKDASVSSYSPVESNSLMDANSSSFGLLGNYGISELPTDFSHDILENYGRSPFLGSGPDGFLDSRSRGDNQGDNRRLDTLTEFGDFCSN